MSVTKIGLEFLVNTTTADAQHASSVVAFDDASFFVAFVNGPNISGQRFDADGNPIGGEVVIGPSEFPAEPDPIHNHAQLRPELARLADGNRVMVWEDARGDGTNELKWKFISGAASPSEGILVSNVADNQIDASVAALTDGGFVVTWRSVGADEIYARVFNAGGSPRSSEVHVNTETDGFQGGSKVTGLNDGRFIVTWSDASGEAPDAGGASVRAQLFQPNGTPDGGEFLLNTTTSGLQWRPAITALAGGGFVALWEGDSAVAPGRSTVVGQVFSAAGAKIGSEIVLPQGADSFQNGVNVAAAPDGGFVAVWHDNSFTTPDSGATNGGIRGQRFAANGSELGAEFQVNSTVAGDQGDAQVAVLPDGRVMVTWTDPSASGGDTSNAAIRGQMFQLEMSTSVFFRSASNGQVIFQTMTDGVAGAFDSLTNPLTPQFRALDVGDANGDGAADVFIWNGATGQVIVTDPTAQGGFTAVATGIAGDYSALGAADINRDGRADLLVHDEVSGSILWQNRAQPGEWGHVGVNLGPAWSYQASGDVNHDGYADVAIRHDSGVVYIADMAGGVNAGYIDLGNISGLTVRAIGDVNGDGFADIVVQSESDGATLWRDLTATQPTEFWKVGTNAMGADWLVSGVADVDLDGRAEVLFQHAETGATIYKDFAVSTNEGWGIVSQSLGGEWIVV